MSKYLKLFETTADYLEYINGSDVVLPNVSVAEDVPTTVYYNPYDPYGGDLYIGFNGSVISTSSQITSLESVQHYNKRDASGTYNITTQTRSYLWICVTGTIAGVSSEGFTIPMNEYITIGDFKCYRSTNDILENTQIEFTITT